jgi:4-diphosphocytidyl-2-C-methyl-D-erythritol kinase
MHAMSEWSGRFAPAKVNLFLHVGRAGPDGYHPVSSLMVFADVGDKVRLRGAERMGFRLEGPFAGALADDPDNLVTRARDRLIEGLASPPDPFELVLEKGLPIAAGLGGGSADAAAALVLIADRLALSAEGGPTLGRLIAVARGLGADVAACLASSSVLGRGRGDELAPAPAMPALNAVLVNPLAPSSTGAVYRAYDAATAAPEADDPDLPAAFASVHQVVDCLRRTRNDLEGPAVALQPSIGQVLEALSRRPEALLSRMSGSGATCFAITADAQAARALAARLATDHPGWWVRPCRLGDSDPSD